MHGIVIGGGIGGMALAAALERVGISCEVHEQAGELREVGAGLTLWSNALLALGRLDAAHPTTPNLGQGACQALEDAVALADHVRRATDVEAALRAYEKARRRRTARITNESWRFGRVCQWQNPLACWLRNTATRFIPPAASIYYLERFFRHP